MHVPGMRMPPNQCEVIVTHEPVYRCCACSQCARCAPCMITHHPHSCLPCVPQACRSCAHCRPSHVTHQKGCDAATATCYCHTLLPPVTATTCYCRHPLLPPSATAPPAARVRLAGDHAGAHQRDHRQDPAAPRGRGGGHQLHAAHPGRLRGETLW